MPNGNTNPRRVERKIHLRWINISDLKISPTCQRELRRYWVNEIAQALDLDKIGTPVVSLRDGSFYVVDGQHRIEALRREGFADYAVECEVRENLTEQQEAALFDKLNNRLKVATFEQFKVQLTAGYPEPVDIDRIVRLQGMHIARAKTPGAIGAVNSLQKIYRAGGAPVLVRTLKITRDAFGDIGLDGNVLQGISLVVQRYFGQLDDTVAVQKLQAIRAGQHGLLNAARRLQKQVGNTLPTCIAAAATEEINRGRGGKKIPAWFSETDS